MYENVKVKPIQPTVADKKTSREIIEYIFKHPTTPEQVERMQKEAAEFLARMMKK
jgi:hypothetical protein